MTNWDINRDKIPKLVNFIRMKENTNIKIPDITEGLTKGIILPVVINVADML